MKFFCILLVALCSATSFGQTIKTLGFNTTNGQVVANTGTNALTFTNAGVAFGGEITISGSTISGPVNSLSFEDGAFTGTIYMDGGSILFSGATNAATTRTNLGLGLPALTNTSNVTMMRALAGSTNTNEPYNGIIQYADGPDGDTYEMTVSNGIILKIEMQ
jgi:hypothetical protein